MSKRLIAYAIAFTALIAGMTQAAPMFSAAERARGLLEGKGMGLATPAENHGYPGPRHVLDAADQLNLTPEQRARAAALVAAMQTEAIPQAKLLLAEEAALDDLFIHHQATLANITAASDRAARAESVLRVIHLKYHLAMEALLTPDQIRAYTALGSHPEQGSSSTPMPAMENMPGMGHSHDH